MSTPTQTGRFFPGTVGFPLGFSLSELTEAEIAEIITMSLVVTRPDGTNFSATLGPGDIVSGVVQYLTQEGDLNAGGVYHYNLTLSMSGDRLLPLLGVFDVPQTDIRSDNTFAARMLALIEAAMEGRLPAGLEYTTINGQSISRIPLKTLAALRDQYYGEVVAERQAVRKASGLPSRDTSYVRFKPVGGFF